MAEKLPPAVAEAAAKSFACLGAVGCAYGRARAFQTRAGAGTVPDADFGVFAAAVCV